MVEKGILTDAEGKNLVKELNSGVFPSDFRFAQEKIHRIFEDLKEEEAAKKKSDKKVLANLKTV